MLLKKNKASTGVTLVEVMIAIALTGIITMGIAAYLSQQGQTVKKIESTLRLNSIALVVQRALRDPSVIRNSADLSSQTGNLALRNCIAPLTQFVSPTLCTATNPRSQVAFELILPLKGASSPSAIEKSTIAGTDVRPALYKILTGEQCSRLSATEDCNVKVRAFFWATCAPEGVDPANTQKLKSTPSACSAAQTIHLRYRVSYEPKVPKTGILTLNLVSVPDDRVFWEDRGHTVMSTFGAITIPVNTIPIPGKVPLQCPTNSTMVSVKDGVPKCECLFPFKPAPGCVSGETCACIDIGRQCLPTERYRGVDLNTGEIQCCPVFCQEGVLADSSQGSAGCGPGGWIETITPVLPALRFPQLKSLPRSSSCMAANECFMGKWGGTCSTDVICKDRYKCCYEYGGTTGASGTCNSGH